MTSAMRGDADAFGELARRHRPEAVLAARSIVGSCHAEDVAQDAFLLAFKSLRTLNDPAKFAPWLRVIVRRAAEHFSRRHRTEEARRTLADPAGAPDPAAPEPEADRLCELLVALERIPSNYAEALRLHFLKGIPLGRAGRILRIPVSTVKWRIHRGKKALRDRLYALGRPVEGAQDWLDLALRRLPPDCARILFEHALEGIPLSQIARDLRVPVSRVERLSELARKQLREELIRLGPESAHANGPYPGSRARPVRRPPRASRRSAASLREARGSRRLVQTRQRCARTMPTARPSSRKTSGKTNLSPSTRLYNRGEYCRWASS